jgi:signal transduction histidine kinase
LKDLINNFTASGMKFGKNQEHLKARYQTLNIGLVLTTISLIYGVVVNIIRDIDGFIPIELFIIVMNISLLFALRKFPKAFEYIVIIMISQYTFLFLFLIYFSSPESMKHSWVFTYPIVLLYLQDTKKSFFWMLFLIAMLLISAIQPFVQIQFSLYQVSYISVVLIIINVIMYFYQIKMKEANETILEQQKLLQNFNTELEEKVKEKTSELRELNDSLEIKVKEKIDELRAKDKILQIQSKQAVMGEMISMIAHQWRQPLSTITLQIANLQFKRLLGQDLSSEKIDEALGEISDTIIYLSDTVDDFQTYFHPDKEMVEVEVNELLQKAVNFTSSRTKNNHIDIKMCDDCSYTIFTYPSEFIQVVLNILNNAIDVLHTSKVQNPTIWIDVESNDRKILVHISDNAGGIQEDVIEQIFEPYFSTKGKNGTGLGLYMSQMIVQKQFSGQIDVKNTEDGTMFSIKVPKHK